MQIYNLSPNALETLKSLAKLSASGVKEFSGLLAENIERFSSPSQAHEVVSACTMRHLDAQSVFSWLDALLPFVFEVLPSSLDSDEVTTSVLAAVRRLDLHRGTSTFTESGLKKLRANLLTIFDNPTTRLKAKSLKLLNSNERSMTACQVYSDIRPVFKVDGKVEVEAAVVFHTLKLEHSGDGSAFFLSLDSMDLRKLKEALERAIEKETALSMLIAKSGVEQIKIS